MHQAMHPAMYSVTVRDHIMVAHSFHGAVFGPARRVHGATFVVDLEFRRRDLDPDGLVVDIGAARALLRAVLDPLDYRNLDEVEDFHGRNTTTEFLCGAIFARVAQRLREGALGDGGRAVEALVVTLHESPLARASFAGPVAP